MRQYSTDSLNNVRQCLWQIHKKEKVLSLADFLNHPDCTTKLKAFFQVKLNSKIDNFVIFKSWQETPAAFSTAFRPGGSFHMIS